METLNEQQRKYLDPTKPLWLPEGSVRAIFTGGALSTAALLLLLQIQVPEWFVGLIVMVTQNYFNARGNETQVQKGKEGDA